MWMRVGEEKSVCLLSTQGVAQTKKFFSRLTYKVSPRATSVNLRQIKY